MTREQAIDEAVRRVEDAYPRTMRLLIEGHSQGEPLGSRGCVACADNVAAIRAVFRAITDDYYSDDGPYPGGPLVIAKDGP